jgi:hypothetical protein
MDSIIKIGQIWQVNDVAPNGSIFHQSICIHPGDKFLIKGIQDWPINYSAYLYDCILLNSESTQFSVFSGTITESCHKMD